MKNKKGQLATSTVLGIVTLVVTLIVAFVLISQINGAGLLTAGSAEQNAVNDLISNTTDGVGNISEKVPTFFTIIAAVLILGFIFFLWARYRSLNLGGAGGGSAL